MLYFFYSRMNFFQALYLAHEVEEECDENRWEILPWALGRRWQGKIINFINGKNELWHKLDFRGIVPCRACAQVMTIPAFREHSVFMRVRTQTHSNTGRCLPDSRSSKHMPHGPVSSFIQPKLMLNLIAFKNIQKGVWYTL